MGAERRACVRQERGDGPKAVVLRVGLRVPGGTQRAVRREAQVVELDLVEPLARGLGPHRDRVRPRLLLEGIEPRQPLGVEPEALVLVSVMAQRRRWRASTLSLKTTMRAMV